MFYVEDPWPHSEYQGVCFCCGLVLLIENRKGSTRSGVGKNGHKWSTLMHHHYGEIDGTRGADNEPVDFYLCDEAESTTAYVIQQKVLGEDETGEAPPGSYDEDKVMIGFVSREEAVAAWRAHYDCELPEPHVVEVPNYELRQWLIDNLYMDPKDTTQQITGWS